LATGGRRGGGSERFGQERWYTRESSKKISRAASIGGAMQYTTVDETVGTWRAVPMLASGRSTSSSATDGGWRNSRTGRHTLPAIGCGHVGGNVKRTAATVRTRPHHGVGKRERGSHSAHDPVSRGSRTGLGPRGLRCRTVQTEA
jgi:hypothetical protein